MSWNLFQSSDPWSSTWIASSSSKLSLLLPSPPQPEKAVAEGSFLDRFSAGYRDSESLREFRHSHAPFSLTLVSEQTALWLPPGTLTMDPQVSHKTHCSPLNEKKRPTLHPVKVTVLLQICPSSLSRRLSVPEAISELHFIKPHGSFNSFNLKEKNP